MVRSILLPAWINSDRNESVAPTWSLAVEEQFYLVLPLVVAVASRRVLASVAVAAVLCGPLARIVIDSHVSSQAAYCWPIARIDAFGWGMLVAILLRHRPMWARVVPAPILAGGAVAAFGLYVSMLFPKLYTDLAIDAFYFSGIDALAACLVLAAALAPDVASITRSSLHRALAWAGERCYALYLFHQGVLGLSLIAMRRIWPDGGVLGILVATCLACVLLAVIADVLYRRVERPFIQFGAGRAWRRLPQSRPVAPTS